jgi:hypothetical protein
MRFSVRSTSFTVTPAGDGRAFFDKVELSSRHIMHPERGDTWRPACLDATMPSFVSAGRIVGTCQREAAGNDELESRESIVPAG